MNIISAKTGIQGHFLVGMFPGGGPLQRAPTHYRADTWVRADTKVRPYNKSLTLALSRGERGSITTV